MSKQCCFKCAIIVFIASVICHAEFQVNSSTTDVQEFPAVAADSAGNFVVVWRSEHEGSRGTYGQRFSAGGASVGGEFKINTTSVGGRISTGPSVAMDPNGNFTVVWTGYRDSEENIIARQYDANGSPLTGEFVVNTDSHSMYENSHIRPSIAMNPSGAFVVVWAAWHGDDGHNGTWGVYGRVYTSDAVPQTDELMINQVPHGYVPEVAMDESGDFVVIWRNEPAYRYVTMRRYDASGTPKTDEIYITEGYNWANTVAIAMDVAGNYVVSYSWGDWHEPNIYAQCFDSNGISQGAAFMVNTSIPGPQYKPAAAMADNGEFVIIWSGSGEGDNSFGIFGQRFLNDGAFVGDEFRINTYVVGEQRYPKVLLREAGSFVAVWQSYEQDGDDYGIFGEIGPKVCCADFSGDLQVNFRDFCVLAEEWLKDENPLKADLIDDNKIDFLDVDELGRQWLQPCYECEQANLQSLPAVVNFQDYALLANDWQKQGPNLDGDITANGIVDVEDLKPLLFYWLGNCYIDF